MAEEETCAGLMWLDSRAIPWFCRADMHVYNVRLGPRGWVPPERRGLLWLPYVLADRPGTVAHVQVRENRKDVILLDLQVDGQSLIFEALAG